MYKSIILIMNFQQYDIKNKIDCNLNYVKITSEYLYLYYANQYTNSYLSIKYLPYKIVGLVIWDSIAYNNATYYYTTLNKQYKYNCDGLNYLPVNVKCLYMNIGNSNFIFNIPALIEYFNWPLMLIFTYEILLKNRILREQKKKLGNQDEILINQLKKLDIFEKEYIGGLFMFVDICNKYCRK